MVFHCQLAIFHSHTSTSSIRMELIRLQENWRVYTCLVGADSKGLPHAIYMPVFYLINFVIPSSLVILCFFRVFQMTRRHLRTQQHAEKHCYVANRFTRICTIWMQERLEGTTRTSIKEIVNLKLVVTLSPY